MHVPGPPILTPRLCLGGFSVMDAADVYAYGSDPEVSKFTSWPTHDSIADSAAWLERVLENERTERGNARQCFAIRLAGSPRAIGAVEFTQKPLERGRVDYVLARPHWGRGIMTEAVSAVIAWAFETMPELTETVSGGLSVNAGSLRVMQKVGMTLDRTEKLVIPKMGLDPVEVSHYRISRTAWAVSR